MGLILLTILLTIKKSGITVPHFLNSYLLTSTQNDLFPPSFPLAAAGNGRLRADPLFAGLFSS